MLLLNETCMLSVNHFCAGNADAKAGSKTRDKLAQELELRMQRERLLASHQMECLLASQSRSKWPSETGVPLCYSPANCM